MEAKDKTLAKRDSSLSRHEDYEKLAKENYEKALLLAPGDLSTQIFLGMSIFERGGHGAARGLHMIESALKSSTEHNRLAYAALGEVLRRSGSQVTSRRASFDISRQCSAETVQILALDAHPWHGDTHSNSIVSFPCLLKAMHAIEL